MWAAESVTSLSGLSHLRQHVAMWPHLHSLYQTCREEKLPSCKTGLERNKVTKVISYCFCNDEQAWSFRQ